MFFDPAYQSLKNGLVGYWSPVATGPTGLQLLDLSGYNNHGTLTNMDAPTDWVDSPYDKVLDFDGTNDQVLNTAPQGIEAVTSQAISFWVNLRSLTVANNITLFYLGRTGTPFNQQLSVGFNILGIGPSNGTSALNVLQYNGSTAPTGAYTSATFGSRLNEWLHFVCGWDGASWRIFVNGSEDTNAQGSGGPTTGFALQMSIGSGQSGVGTNWGRFFDGRIAEVAYWHRFLARSEVQTLYSIGPGKLIRSKPTGGPSKRKWWPGVKTPKSRPIIPTQRGIKAGPIFYDPKASWFRNGLVGHWCPNLTGATGTQLLDLSGQNNNGTLTNMDAPTDWVQSEKGLVLDFDGSNDEVLITDSPALNPTAQITVGLWYNSRSLPGGTPYNYTLLAKSTSVNAQPYPAWDIRGSSTTTIEASVAIGVSSRQISLGTINTNEWTFVSFTYNGSSFVGYRNGLQVASSAQTGAIGTTTNPISIGNNYGFPPRFFNGRIAEFNLWNRALTASEIQQLFNRGPGGFASSKPYRRSSYSPAPKKIFKSRIDRKRSVSLVHPDQDNQWITNGLVGFWCPSLTGATGLQLLDLSGQNNNGTLTNMDAPTDWVDSAQGLALDFDGIDDNVVTSSPGPATTNRAMTLWFNTSKVLSFGTYQYIVGFGAGNFDQGFSIIQGNDGSNFGGNAIGVTQWGNGVSVAGFNDGKWHQITVVNQGTLWSIYMDGIFRTSKTMTTNPVARSLIIGRQDNTAINFYTGQLASVTTHNRALNPSEVQALYQLGPRMGFSNRPSRSPTWMVEADETIGNRRRRIICGGVY